MSLRYIRTGKSTLTRTGRSAKSLKEGSVLVHHSIAVNTSKPYPYNSNRALARAARRASQTASTSAAPSSSTAADAVSKSDPSV